LRISSAELTSSLQVALESSNDRSQGVGNVEGRKTDAIREAVDDDSSEICLHGSCVSHAVAQVAIHSHMLHLRGLELSMSMMRIWRFIDYLITKS
jgi:hypothetical protein